MLNSVDEVIEAVGGDAAAQSLAGVGASAISNWRSRGKITADKFLLFSEAVRASGKEIDPGVFAFKAPVEARV